MDSPYVQRLRIHFGKVGATRWIGHLDLSRTWERGLNRTTIPVAYTQGFNRRPKMQFASALPLGYTSDSEYVDLWLTARLDLSDASAQLRQKMPRDVVIHGVEEVDMRQEALPTLVTTALFRAEMAHAVVDVQAVSVEMARLLSADSWPVARERGKQQGKVYDLRPLLQQLTWQEGTEHPTLLMELRVREDGPVGRPDAVLAAIGLDPLAARIHRLTLNLAEIN